MVFSIVFTNRHLPFAIFHDMYYLCIMLVHPQCTDEFYFNVSSI